MHIIYLLFITFLYACSSPNNRIEGKIEEQALRGDNYKEKTNIIAVDTIAKVAVKSNNVVQIKNSIRSKPIYARSIGAVSDNSVNGEPIIIQMDLPQKVLNENTDTVLTFLNNYYVSMERYFPHSIADNFEKRVSTSHIYYPTLYFKVQLFENEYADKPYKIVEHAIYNESDKAKIEGAKALPVFDWADQMPSVFAHKQDLRTYMQNAIVHPAKVRQQGISGTSWLTFIVEIDGSITDLRVEKEFENCKECDDEVLRMAKSMPALNPGTLNGEKVRIRIKQGITF